MTGARDESVVAAPEVESRVEDESIVEPGVRYIYTLYWRHNYK